MFAVPSMEVLPAYVGLPTLMIESSCATAVRNWAALSRLGSLTTDEAEALVLYSTCVPWCPEPDLVVISTTPLAAFAP